MHPIDRSLDTRRLPRKESTGMVGESVVLPKKAKAAAAAPPANPPKPPKRPTGGGKQSNDGGYFRKGSQGSYNYGDDKFINKLKGKSKKWDNKK